MNEFVHLAAKTVLPSKLYGWIRLRRLRAQRDRFSVRVVEHVYGGVALKVMLADPVGQDWYDCEWEALPEIKLLKDHGLKKGARVFDLGAHQGVVALMLADAVGSQGQVISVEANPFNASIAEKNRELNQASQVCVVNVAVADKPGSLTFNEDSNGQVDASGKLGRIEVAARTMDSLAEEFGNPNVLFLDVEGFECSALRGGSKVLASRPDCFVEVHVGAGLEELGGSLTELISYFPACAYQYFVRGPAQTDSSFKSVKEDFFSSSSELLQKRFFLVALARTGVQQA